MENSELRIIFKEAQCGNKEAVEKVLAIFQPLILKHSVENGVINEDLFQELSIKLLYCIKNFQFKPTKNYMDDIHKINAIL